MYALKLEQCIVLRAEELRRSVVTRHKTRPLKCYFHKIMASEIKIIEYKIEYAVFEELLHTRASGLTLASLLERMRP